MKILHKLRHLLGLTSGRPFSFYDGDKLMMSFQCGVCGNLSMIHCVEEEVLGTKAYVEKSILKIVEAALEEAKQEILLSLSSNTKSSTNIPCTCDGDIHQREPDCPGKEGKV